MKFVRGASGGRKKCESTLPSATRSESAMTASVVSECSMEDQDSRMMSPYVVESCKVIEPYANDTSRGDDEECVCKLKKQANESGKKMQLIASSKIRNKNAESDAQRKKHDVSVAVSDDYTCVLVAVSDDCYYNFLPVALSDRECAEFNIKSINTYITATSSVETTVFSFKSLSIRIGSIKQPVAWTCLISDSAGLHLNQCEVTPGGPVNNQMELFDGDVVQLTLVECMCKVSYADEAGGPEHQCRRVDDVWCDPYTHSVGEYFHTSYVLAGVTTEEHVLWQYSNKQYLAGAQRTRNCEWITGASEVTAPVVEWTREVRSCSAAVNNFLRVWRIRGRRVRSRHECDEPIAHTTVRLPKHTGSSVVSQVQRDAAAGADVFFNRVRYFPAVWLGDKRMKQVLNAAAVVMVAVESASFEVTKWQNDTAAITAVGVEMRVVLQRQVSTERAVSDEAKAVDNQVKCSVRLVRLARVAASWPGITFLTTCELQGWIVQSGVCNNLSVRSNLQCASDNDAQSSEWQPIIVTLQCAQRSNERALISEWQRNVSLHCVKCSKADVQNREWQWSVTLHQWCAESQNAGVHQRERQRSVSLQRAECDKAGMQPSEAKCAKCSKAGILRQRAWQRSNALQCAQRSDGSTQPSEMWCAQLNNISIQPTSEVTRAECNKAGMQQPTWQRSATLQCASSNRAGIQPSDVQCVGSDNASTHLSEWQRSATKLQCADERDKAGIQQSEWQLIQLQCADERDKACVQHSEWWLMKLQYAEYRSACVQHSEWRLMKLQYADERDKADIQQSKWWLMKLQCVEYRSTCIQVSGAQRSNASVRVSGAQCSNAHVQTSDVECNNADIQENGAHQSKVQRSACKKVGEIGSEAQQQQRGVRRDECSNARAQVSEETQHSELQRVECGNAGMQVSGVKQYSERDNATVNSETLCRDYSNVATQGNSTIEQRQQVATMGVSDLVHYRNRCEVVEVQASEIQYIGQEHQVATMAESNEWDDLSRDEGAVVGPSERADNDEKVAAASGSASEQASKGNKAAAARTRTSSNTSGSASDCESERAGNDVRSRAADTSECANAYDAGSNMRATECTSESMPAGCAIEATAASAGESDSERATAAIAANSDNMRVCEEAEDAMGAAAEQTSDEALRDSRKQARMQRRKVSGCIAEQACNKRSAQQGTLRTDVQQLADRCTFEVVDICERSELSTDENAVTTPLRELSSDECSAEGEFDKLKAEGLARSDQQYRTVHAECTSPTARTCSDIIVEAIATEWYNGRYSCKQSTQQRYNKQYKQVGSIFIVDISVDACVRARMMHAYVQQEQRRTTHVRH